MRSVVDRNVVMRRIPVLIYLFIYYHINGYAWISIGQQTSKQTNKQTNSNKRRSTPQEVSHCPLTAEIEIES